MNFCHIYNRFARVYAVNIRTRNSFLTVHKSDIYKNDSLSNILSLVVNFLLCWPTYPVSSFPNRTYFFVPPPNLQRLKREEYFLKLVEYFVNIWAQLMHNFNTLLYTILCMYYKNLPLKSYHFLEKNHFKIHSIVLKIKAYIGSHNIEYNIFSEAFCK